MANPRWSYSRFSTFSSCQNKYNLSYQKELSVIGKEIAVQHKGLAFHEIAEMMNSKLSYEELMIMAQKKIDGKEFDQEKFPVIKAIPRLWEWWQEFVTPFENQGYQLKKESWENGIIADKKIVGALDTLLIDEIKKEVRIYDFKTPKTPNASNYSKQLILYAYLIGTRLGIKNISEHVKLFVFFPLANLKDEELTDKAEAKKQAMKMMKQIDFTEDDIYNVVTEFEEIIKLDATIDWENADPRMLAQLNFTCSWCDFAGNKQYCPISYESGCRFPRKAKVITKEERDAQKNKAGV
jgi:hypothetical protein